MTAADELDAAYMRLENEREAARPAVDIDEVWGTYDRRLVMTVLRTIDAQLLIIRAAYDKAVGPYSVLEDATVERLLAGPLALARAITEAPA